MSFLENLISDFFPFSILIITGLYLTFKSGFSQIFSFKNSMKLTAQAFKENRNTKEITSYKAACTALSATVGTGNIAGVAGAISIGGAGAVFWMWISAVLGMIIKATEISLAIIYREKSKDGFVGGPMYYIKNGLTSKFSVLGIIFCAAAIPSVFCSGNITQVNSAIISFCDDNILKALWGIIFAFACALAISGNFQRIAKITEKLVPAMSLLYIIICFVVIIKNFDLVPRAFKMIFEGAFNPRAVTGGAVGSVLTCMFIGSSRGIFSNEAGLGTSAMAHSAAIDAKAEIQGLYGIFEVFVDTLLLCTLTALTILCSSVKINYGTVASTELVSQVMKSVFGNFGSILLSVMMCLFGFSSIIGWAVYGKICCNYILGEKADRFFTAIYPLFCILGAVAKSGFVWRLAAFCNGIMLCTNLAAILLLSDKTIKYLKGMKKSDKEKNRKFKRNSWKQRRGNNIL